MKIITMFCLFLLATPAMAENRDDDIVLTFIQSTYQRRLVQNHALAATMVVPDRVKKSINFDPEQDAELFNALVKYIEKQIENEAQDIVTTSYLALDRDEEFLKAATEAALDKFSVKEMKTMMAQGITDDSIWLDMKTWEDVVDAAKSTTNRSIKSIEKRVDKLVEETIAALPQDREQQLSYLHVEADPLQQANEAWQQITYGFISYAKDNADKLKDENGEMLPKCWGPDAKLRDHFSRIKFLDVSFQCFRIEQNGSAAYGYFPLVLIEHCLKNNESADCQRLFSQAQLSQIAAQIAQYNKE